MADAGVPYQYQDRYSVTAGADNCVEVPAPIRGRLRRLVVQQVSGALDGFTVRLYTSESACGRSGNSYADVADASLLSESMFQIGYDYVVAASSDLLNQQALDVPYVDNEMAGNGRLKSALFVKLTPAGSGTKVFDVGYTIDTPSF